MSDLILNEADLDSVVKRLKRARGQLDGVVRMLEEQRDCGDIVTQMAAVSKAIDRAGFAIIASGLEQCVREGETADVTRERLNRMFLTLA